MGPGSTRLSTGEACAHAQPSERVGVPCHRETELSAAPGIDPQSLLGGKVDDERYCGPVAWRTHRFWILSNVSRSRLTTVPRGRCVTLYAAPAVSHYLARRTPWRAGGRHTPLKGTELLKLSAQLADVHGGLLCR